VQNKTHTLLRVFDAGANTADIEAAVEASVALKRSREMPVIAEPPPAPAPAPAAAPIVDSVPVVDTIPGRTLFARVCALGMLVATLGVFAWAGMTLYYALSDSWVAPLRLSPQSDVVTSLRLQYERNLAELARIDAEVSRLDGELVAIDDAHKRLEMLRGAANATLMWQADVTRVESTGLATTAALLRRQRDQLAQVQVRQQGILARARKDLAAGLIDVSVMDREEQVADRLAVEITDVERQLAETKLKKSHARTTLQALDKRDLMATSRMPEVVEGNERDMRIEIELQRLGAEARGHRALRSAAVANLGNQRALLSELEARPLYRAMKSTTDVAFVPYDQLAGVTRGANVLACTWGVFACHAVGTIAEIMPGEVVTQDPWGELARGQYVVLKLDDKDAVYERVLRVR